MSFASYSFIFIFLPLALIVSSRFAPGSSGAIFVAILISLLFYLANDPHNLLILMLSIVGNWLIGRAIAKRQERVKSMILPLAIFANLCLLALFKLPESGLAKSDVFTALPLGISYFTFTQIAFLVDVTKGQSRAPSGIEYALFVAWFPHLPAGPLLSHKEMFPQFSLAGNPDAGKEQLMRRCAVGLTLFAIGLFKKACLSPLFHSTQGDFFTRAALAAPVGTGEAWVACLGFLFEAYFDFCGYSEMAMGVSRMFGVHLPVNFHAPFRSSSPVEFWTRWHITLGRFMRDYLYRPMTRTRKIWRHYMALIVVMLCVAFWHRATAPMLAFGLFQGFLLVGNHALRRWSLVSRQGGTYQTWAGRVFTLAAITFSVSMWAAPDWPAAVHVMGALTGAGGHEILTVGPLRVAVLVVAILVGWFSPSLIDMMANELPAWSFQTKNRVECTPLWGHNVTWAFIVASALGVALAFLSGTSGFKYAEF